MGGINFDSPDLQFIQETIHVSSHVGGEARINAPKRTQAMGIMSGKAGREIVNTPYLEYREDTVLSPIAVPFNYRPVLCPFPEIIAHCQNRFKDRQVGRPN
jgi:hypothetical protein